MIGDILPDILAGCGLEISEASVNSTDERMRQIVSLMNQTGQELAQRAQWSEAYGSATVPANTASFALPDDFYRMPENGSIILGDGEPVRMIVDTPTWAFAKGKNSSQYYCHLQNKNLLFAPDSSDRGASFSYVKKGWLRDGTEYVSSNLNEPIFPELLLKLGVIWRWRRQTGQNYQDQIAEFEASFVSAIHADRGMA